MSAEHPSDELQAQFDFVKWGAQLRAELSQSLAGVWLRGAESRPVGLTSQASARVSNSPGRLVGWSLSLDPAAAGPARVDLYDGTDNTGTLVGSADLIVSRPTSNFSHHGIGFVRGLYCDISGAGAASVRGSVYLGKTE